MKVEVRLYKRFDVDLVSMVDAGYPVSTMMKDALISYANGDPIHYLIDENLEYSFRNKNSVRFRLTIPNEERNAIYVLQSIKHGYRNNFLKSLLRNALVQQNLGCYFSDLDVYSLHDIERKGLPVKYYDNLIPLSTIRVPKEVTFNDRTVRIEHNTVQAKTNYATKPNFSNKLVENKKIVNKNINYASSKPSNRANKSVKKVNNDNTTFVNQEVHTSQIRHNNIVNSNLNNNYQNQGYKEPMINPNYQASNYVESNYNPNNEFNNANRDYIESTTTNRDNSYNDYNNMNNTNNMNNIGNIDVTNNMNISNNMNIPNNIDVNNSYTHTNNVNNMDNINNMNNTNNMSNSYTNNSMNQYMSSSEYNNEPDIDDDNDNLMSGEEFANLLDNL